MSDDPIANRKGLTFKQAEGLAPLPSQLRLGEVSQEMRSYLFLVFHNHVRSIYNSYGPNLADEDWSAIMMDNHVLREHRMVDEFKNYYDSIVGKIKKIIQSSEYGEILDLVQFVLQHENAPDGFSEDIAVALERSRSPYRVVQERWIAPLLGQADQIVVTDAFKTVDLHGLAGARTHLQEAAAAASTGHWARSINASVDALEAAVRTVTGKNTFTEAMKDLESKTKLHKALGNSIRRFYDFTSDEKGLRHSNAELEQASVDEGDALYALGTCSAAISMLVRKAEEAGL